MKRPLRRRPPSCCLGCSCSDCSPFVKHPLDVCTRTGLQTGSVETPRKNRKPKVQVALRPGLARVFRRIAKLEKRQLSEVFEEMLEAWRKLTGKHNDLSHEEDV